MATVILHKKQVMENNMSKSTWIRPKNVLLAVLAFSLIIVIFIADDYGINADTQGIFEFGKASLNAYSLKMISNPLLVKDTLKVITPPTSEHSTLNLRYYGPFFHITAQLVIKILEYLGSTIDPFVVYRFLIHAMFLIGVWCLYILCKRYMKDWFALFVALAFLFQPLLFGHAFINSKDIPFMSLFIVSVTVGFRMVDHLDKNYRATQMNNETSERGNFLYVFLQDFKDLSRKEKFKISLIAVSWITVVIVTVSFINMLDEFVTHFIMTLYNAPPSSIFGQIFSAVATSKASITIDAYITKGLILFHRVLNYLLVIIFSLLMVLLIQRLPRFKDFLVANLRKIVGELIQLPKDVISCLTNKSVLFAGIILGLSISTRNVGFAAGGIIGLLLLYRRRGKALAPGISYIAVAALATLATWPYLWHDPWRVFIKSIKYMQKHPWNQIILYDGQFYWPSELPTTYFPKLIAIQFTIPIIVLSIFGFIYFFCRWKKFSRTIELLLIAMWFIIPFTYVVVARPTVYHNFRQFLFITPPLFIFTGIMISWIGERIKDQRWLILLVLVVILPGIWGVIDLHPYQYVYYNEFVGGVGGAFRIYENDYWCTSFQDAMTYINKHAEAGSRVLIWGSPSVASFYAREDLEILSQHGITSIEDYDYALFLTRKNADLSNARSAEIVYEVVVRDSVLALVKKLR